MQITDPESNSKNQRASSKNRLGEDMQKEQEEVRQILKIKNPDDRRAALKEYATRVKNDFSDEPATEILNLSLMQPKFQPSVAKKKSSVVEEAVVKRKPFASLKPTSLRDSIYFQTDEEYEEYLLETLEKEGLFPELYKQLKIFYISRKNIPALTSVWEHLYELDMTAYQALMEQAEVLIQMEEMEKAFVFLDRAVRLEPDNLAGIRAISLYHKLSREYELAIHWMEKWKKLDHTNPEVFYHTGSILRRTGMKDLAITELRRCLHLDQNHVMARSLLEKLDR